MARQYYYFTVVWVNRIERWCKFLNRTTFRWVECDIEECFDQSETPFTAICEHQQYMRYGFVRLDDVATHKNIGNKRKYDDHVLCTREQETFWNAGDLDLAVKKPKGGIRFYWCEDIEYITYDISPQCAYVIGSISDEHPEDGFVRFYYEATTGEEMMMLPAVDVMRAHTPLRMLNRKNRDLAFGRVLMFPSYRYSVNIGLYFFICPFSITSTDAGEVSEREIHNATTQVAVFTSDSTCNDLAPVIGKGIRYVSDQDS